MPKATPKSIAQFYEDLLKAVDGISDEKDAIFLEARRHLAYTYQLAVKGDPEKKIAALESAMLKASCEACEAAMKEAGRAILASFPSRQDDDGKRILELKTPAHLEFITKYQQHLTMLRDGVYDYRGVYAGILAWDPTGYVDRKKKQGQAETQGAIDELELAIAHYSRQQKHDSEVSAGFPVFRGRAPEEEVNEEDGASREPVKPAPVQDGNSEVSTKSPSGDEVNSHGSTASSDASSSHLPPAESSRAEVEGVYLPKYAKVKVNIADAKTLEATYLLLLHTYWEPDQNSSGYFDDMKARIAAFFIHILSPVLVGAPIRFLGTTPGFSYFFPRMREAVEVFDRKVQVDVEAARGSESVSPPPADEGLSDKPVARPAFLPESLPADLGSHDESPLLGLDRLKNLEEKSTLSTSNSFCSCREGEDEDPVEVATPSL